MDEEQAIKEIADRLENLVTAVKRDNYSKRTGVLNNMFKTFVFLPIAGFKIIWKGCESIGRQPDKSRINQRCLQNKSESLARFESLFSRIGSLEQQSREGLFHQAGNVILEMIPTLDNLFQFKDSVAFETAPILFNQSMPTPTLIPLISLLSCMLHEFYSEPEHHNPGGRAIIGHLLTICRSEFEKTKCYNLDNIRLVAELIYFCNRLPLMESEASTTIDYLVVALEGGIHTGVESAVRGLWLLMKTLFRSDRHPSLRGNDNNAPLIIRSDIVNISIQALQRANQRQWPSGSSIQQLIRDTRLLLRDISLDVIPPGGNPNKI